jgi:hypothetical protein
MYKVRFHLARGENFMKWQVKEVDKKTATPAYPKSEKTAKEITEYFDPEEVSIAMFGCTLRIHPKTAQKIHDGENKSVCGWVECEHYQITPKKVTMTMFDWRVRFNPKAHPHWVDDADRILDNDFIPLLLTSGRQMYCVPTYE